MRGTGYFELPSPEIVRERFRVVDEARTWLGTPFHHCAQVRGVAVDCAQLLIAVYVAAGIVAQAPEVGQYSPEWFLHEASDRFTRFVAAECLRLPSRDDLRAGDLLLFTFGRSAAHGAIVSAWPVLGDKAPRRIIHAWKPAGAVVEDELTPEGPLDVRIHSCWSFARWHGEHQRAA